MADRVIAQPVWYEQYAEECGPYEGQGLLWLRYHPGTAAVQIEFADGVVWEFARSLILDGLHSPAGLADVRVAPYFLTRVAVTLSSDDGRCFLLLDRAPVALFAESIRLFADTPNIDALIARIFAKERRR